MKNRKVVVAMSGGVDSSVAAALLLENGYRVVGVTLRLRPGPGGRAARQEPISSSEQDAREVASKLGIPHVILDVRDDFARCVVWDFVEGYRRGSTPNPCVRCNPEVKFASVLRYAREVEADKAATGHYARVERDEAADRWKLLRGVDRLKDQSYVLYRLTQAQLSRILMPVGYKTKDEVRARAAELGLKVLDRAESQDVCFIPQGRYQDFLRRHAPDTVKPGPIVDSAGNVIGQHQGVAFFTIGQRRGLRVASGRRLYVTGIDAASNTVVAGGADELTRKVVVVKDVNLISGGNLTKFVVVSAKIRYNTQDRGAVVRPLFGDWIELVFDEDQRAVTPGQSAVFYQGEEVLGGGIIADKHESEWARSQASCP